MAGPLDRDPLAIDWPRALLAALTFTLIVAILLAASTSTAAFGAYNPAWDGASDLRAQADAVGADSEIVLNTSTYGEVEESQTVALVLSPDRPYTPGEADRLRRFLRRGGTLVVAEDFGPHGNALLRDLGADARFDGVLVRDERHNYRTPAMPVARNVSDHPLSMDVNALTLNHGSTLEPGNATVVVRTSEFAYSDVNRNDQLDETETLASSPVVAVEPIGQGRVISVSDPSLFINAMLDRSGNRQFVRNVFGTGEQVLLDYSHAERLPPLALVVVVVRQTPVLQVLLGLLGLAIVGAWSRGSLGRLGLRMRETIRPRLRDSTSVHLGDWLLPDTPEETGVDQASLVAYLRHQHPEWDEERVRRVTKGVITGRAERRDDE